MPSGTKAPRSSAANMRVCSAYRPREMPCACAAMPAVWTMSQALSLEPAARPLSDDNPCATTIPFPHNEGVADRSFWAEEGGASGDTVHLYGHLDKQPE